MAFNPQCLKDILEETPMTLDQLAESTDVSKGALHQYMQGRAEPNLKTLIKLADFLAIPLDILVGRCTEDQYKAIMDDYHKQFMQLRRAPYAAYILRKHSKTNFRIDPSDVHVYDMEAPWPNNLVDKLCGETVALYMDQDHMNGLNKVLNMLSDRERKAIELYFEEGLNLEKSAKYFGITRERVRQILAKALRKMRHPSKLYFILYGENGAMQKLQIQTFERQISQKERELKELMKQLEKLKEENAIAQEEPTTNVIVPAFGDLMDRISVRSYNCMRRSGCNTVEDIIARFSEGDVHKIRNFGKVSCREVLNELQTHYGFTMSFEEVW